MAHSHQDNAQQAALWNGPAGRGWVEAQDVLDQMFKPFERLLVEAVAARGASTVLDVGCGTGGTTLAMAQSLGAQAQCVGIDISQPMIKLARERAEQAGASASFVCADAQVHAFKPGSFDAIVSRFGVMFFSDPVQAFAHLRQAAKEGGELHFFAWRGPQENPFMTTAERVAAPLLPTLPARQAKGPGQFAFADRQDMVAIMEEGGWAHIDVQPIDVVCTLAERDLIRYLSWLGPVGQFLQQADEPTRIKVITTLRAAFEPHVQDGEIRYTAACWSAVAVAC